jgi:putative phage-type endonuclease
MKRSNSYKQNSKDWYAWRDQGLGASEAPVVMGDQSFSTRFELWAQKTKLLERPELNVYALKAMDRGKELEPKAVSWYERKTGMVVERDVNCEHPVYSFLRASLDGYVPLIELNIEVKSPGKEDLAKAKKGIIPEKYIPQVQMQMLVSGCAYTDYVTYSGEGVGYFDGEDGKVITIKADPVYQQKLLVEMMYFWGLILAKMPPVVSQEDVERLEVQIKKAQEKLKKLEAGMDLLKRCMIENPKPEIGPDGLYKVN